ncbi:ATP-binding protein [Niveispirillum sp.]|uniref:ATP-binding protein n=1 Tax=Niveispirillum sp. TaxID=1917217 RepID=UPI001B512B6A|nr:ATP-binding protein [Niveispirillum sp.]MBP7338477.1 ATP-binding protein [Niveispirillum sp.]
MVSDAPHPAAGSHPSIGGEVPPVLLRRLAEAHGLVHGDWEVEAAEDGGLFTAPIILVTLRGSARELRAALDLGTRAYVELGDDEELPAGLLAGLTGQLLLHLSLSTITSFSLDMAPQFCAALLARGWLDAQRRADAEICVHEAVSNAIVHGNLDIHQGPSADVGAFDSFFRAVQDRLADRAHANRRVTVEAVAGPEELCIRISDQGRGHSGLAPTSIDRLEAKSGRGLRIMDELADRVSFSDAGRTVNLYFRR